MNKIIVLGGTGYIANRLVPRLLDKGYKVKVSYRDRAKLTASWKNCPNVELVYADAFDKGSLVKAFKDCSIIYYLLHSMETAYYKHLVENEIKSAENTIEAALENNVSRLIFLGGVSSSNNVYSQHLRSRVEVGDLFLKSPVVSTVFKAGIIIGGASAAFEITRKLLHYYPIVLLPKSMNNRTQPTAITNMIYYLVQCLEVPETMNKAFEVGGEQILSFKDIVTTTAHYLGMRPFYLPAPFLSANLSSIVISKGTAVPEAISRSLTSSMITETLCKEHIIRDLIPQRLVPISEEIYKIVSEWKSLITCDILGKPNKFLPWTTEGDYPWAGFLIFRDHRYMILKGNREAIWKTISKIGGKRGYFAGNWLWQIRGYLNKLMGGKGLNKAPKVLQKGEKFDFWTVYRVKPYEELVLWNEMVIPGQATLTYRIQEIGNNKFILHQLVRYYPLGINGILNWILMYGFHQYEMPKMITKIATLSRSKIIQKGRKNPVFTKDGRLLLKSTFKKKNYTCKN